MNDKEKQQLINEVNILRELKHENIVRCYDKFVDKRGVLTYYNFELRDHTLVAALSGRKEYS